LLFISLILLTGAAGYSTYKTSIHEMEEILDGHMITNSRALFSLIVVELQENHFNEIPVILDSYLSVLRNDESLESPERIYEAYESDFHLQLVDSDGTSVFSSNDQLLINADEQRRGFFPLTHDELEWHVLGLKDYRSGFTLYTAQSDNVRKEFSREAIKYMFMPLLIGMVLILISVWIAIHLGLKPLNTLGDELDKRDLKSLKPLDETYVLDELRPVISSLNRLFRRMSVMIENEKQFSAAVSHELRTPLARIMASTDALETTTIDPSQLRQIHYIHASSIHAKELTDDLLLLSKLGQSNAREYFECEHFNVTQFIKMEVDELELQYPDQKNIINISMEGNSNPILQGSSSLFSILVRNILINALLHGGRKAPIDIRVISNEAVSITIRDHGPGVPDKNIPELFQRFYRGQQGNSGSTGLGLAIVNDIAKYFSATVDAANVLPTGLAITLVFPRML
jgi:two-component system sensor histidine kinase QseC